MSSLMSPIVDSCKTIMSSLDLRKISKMAVEGTDTQEIAASLNKDPELVEAVVSDLQQRPSFGIGLSEKEALKFDRLVADGVSASKLARIFGVPKDRVIKTLKSQGLYVSRKVTALTEDEVKTILTLDESGMKSNEIASQIERDVTSVRKVLRENRPKTSNLTSKEKLEVERYFLEYRLNPSQIAKLLSTKNNFRSQVPIRDYLRSIGLFFGKKTELEAQDKSNIRRYILVRHKSVSATASALKLNYNLVADYANSFNELKYSEDMSKETRIKIRTLFKTKKDYMYVANEVLVKPSLVLAFLKDRGLIKDLSNQPDEQAEKRILNMLIARRRKIIEDIACITGVHPEVIKQMSKKLK